MSDLNSPLTLIELNDDCLLKILDYFTISELLIIHKVCQRLHLLVDRCRHKYGILDTGYQNQDEVCNIMKFLGPYLKVAKIHRNELFFDTMLQFCPNVEGLTLLGFKFGDPENVRKLNLIIKKLKDLDLRYCEFDDDLGEIFKDSSKLESFTIVENDKITGNFFRNISTLKCLQIVQCLKMGTEFAQILIKNPNLEVLGYNLYINDEILKEIVNHGKNLKVLNLEFESRIPSPLSYLADLPNLKKILIDGEDVHSTTELNLLVEKLGNKNTIEELEIFSRNTLDINLIVKLTNLKGLSLGRVRDADLMKLQKLTKLEKLVLLYSHNFTQNNFLDLIKTLKNLTHLHISDAEMTYEWMKELIEILQQQAKFRPKLVMKIDHICGTVLEELKTLLGENRNVLRITDEVEYDVDYNLFSLV